MKMRHALMGGVVGCLLAVLSVQAHHSFSAEYDADRPVTLKGTVTKLEWVNPHSWLYIDVKGSSGAVTHWAVETSTPNTLLRRGLRLTDFAIGAEIIVEGYRAKDGTATANCTTMRFKDGGTFVMGSAGADAREP